MTLGIFSASGYRAMAISKSTAGKTLLIRDTFQGVATLTLNQPEKRNALSGRMINLLQEALDELDQDNTVRVVVIQGSGPAFCSGHDLTEIRSATTESRKQLFRDCSQVMVSLVRLSKPVIAKIHGPATAAGCQLVASCDLAVASSEARFATPGVNIGLWCHTPQVAVSRNVSAKHTMEMLLTGEMIDAEMAQRIGLINTVVLLEELDETVHKLAKKITAKSMKTVQRGKKSFYSQVDLTLEQAYEQATEIMSKGASTAESAEGISAFLEKRAPHWNEPPID